MSTELGGRYQYRVSEHDHQHLARTAHLCVATHSPCDEAGGDGGPGDAAGAGLLCLLLIILAAAAQTAQVDGQTQKVEAEPHGHHTGQEYKRLEETNKQVN